MAQAVLGTAMLRFQTADGWMLIEHQDHAHLAGEFASHYGNDRFDPPEPLGDILVAVSRHDDAWKHRDALPFLTRENKPSAFSKELVGKYSAFEEIDLIDYLAVRGQATEAVAADNPYAAILISMHTVNLLTDQADLSTLPPLEREAHAKFIAYQILRQKELANLYSAAGGKSENVSPSTLRRAFEFLQLCDNLSLLVCVGFPTGMGLRHEHPDKDGVRVKFNCMLSDTGRFKLSPYPFHGDNLTFQYPARFVPNASCANRESFCKAYQAATVQTMSVTIMR